MMPYSTARAESSLFTLFDTSLDSLGVINTVPSNSSYLEVALLQDVPSLGDVAAVRMDFSADGRIFAVLDNQTVIHEIDAQTGVHLGSFDVGVPLEGIAALENGQIFVNWEHHGILDVNYDARTSNLAVSYADPIDIDGIDFDSSGNLIGSDLNESGMLYRIDLNGNSITPAGQFSNISAGDITYSPTDDTVYFLAQDTQELWQVPWLAGSPSGPLSLTKDIPSPGRALGLAFIPEPSTVMFFSLTPIVCLRMRRRNSWS